MHNQLPLEIQERRPFWHISIKITLL